VSRSTPRVRLGPCHLSPVTRRSQEAVALVVTLLLLSVITFMAVTFLVVSRNEKGSVTQTTDHAVAGLAADAGLEKAKVDLVVGMITHTNEFEVGLRVPTNYINSFGFVPGNT